jgi:hypothetical protein
VGEDNGRWDNLLNSNMKGTKNSASSGLWGPSRPVPGGLVAAREVKPGSRGYRRVEQLPITSPPAMLKTVIVLGVLALLAIFAVKLLFILLGFAIPVLLLGFLIYGVLVVFAPDRAARLKSRIAEI